MTDDQNPKIPVSFSSRIPDGDDRERSVCDHCSHISYENPKIVTGSVIRHDGRILLCRRAIEPRKGFWTLPAGYMELQETVEEGARREAMEEAEADIVIRSLLAVYTVPRISQVQLFYRAVLATSHFAPGPESLEVELFTWEDIPWEEIAFPTAYAALHHDREVPDTGAFAPFQQSF
jgi:ADP-ribose pyrophosphatase YjhB (NUDIX family)